MKKLAAFILSAITFFGCQNQVDPDLGNALNVLVIDAWLTNTDTILHINVTRSQPYFENSAPQKEPGADVELRDLTDPGNGPYVFVEDEERYTWTSPDGNPLGVIGNEYELVVELDGVTYTSTTRLNRVMPIDSIQFRIESAVFFEDLTYAEVYAQDLVGKGDTYWIKSWKNGNYLGQPFEINLAYDAGFSQGGNVDGEVFIQPIRQTINTFEDAKNGEFISPVGLPEVYFVDNNGTVFTKDNKNYGTIANDSIFFNIESNLVPRNAKPAALDNMLYSLEGDSLYFHGDSMYVEVHSISNEAFDFLSHVVTETTREGGFGALFATPLSNVGTNIMTDDKSAMVAGFFNFAAVSSMGRRLTSEAQLVEVNR